MVLKQPPRCLGSFDSICRQPPPIERKGLFPEGRGIICARGGTLGRTEEGEGSLNLKDIQRGIKAGSRWRWWLWRWWSDWLTAIQPNLTDKITLCLLWIHPETHPTSPPPPNLWFKKMLWKNCLCDSNLSSQQHIPEVKLQQNPNLGSVGRLKDIAAPKQEEKWSDPKWRLLTWRDYDILKRVVKENW